jgi:hypothetical protein
MMRQLTRGKTLGETMLLFWGLAVGGRPTACDEHPDPVFRGCCSHCRSVAAARLVSLPVRRHPRQSVCHRPLKGGSRRMETFLRTWLEWPSVAHFIDKYTWAWPLGETFHFFGIILLIGGVGMFDLRLLGIANRR